MGKILSILLVATTLSGCAGQRAAYDDGKCRSYGAAPGSSAYVNCRAQLDAARTHANAVDYATTNANAQQFIYGPVR